MRNFRIVLFYMYINTLAYSLAILSGGSVFSNHPTPRFLSRGNTFKVVTGDTVVLPCEIQNLGKGKRLIIYHKSNENGFVAEGLWCFKSKKTGDYHEEMNGETFEQWFSKGSPHLEDNAVILMDNAPYHSRRLDKIPTTSSKKVKIQNWLRSKNISFEDSMLRVQLLKIVKERKLEYQKYIVDEMAVGQNKIFLRLPSYHCELNPIELIWADVKYFVAQHNNTFKFADLKVIFDEALKRVTAEKWEKCVRHVISEVETKMWKLDNIIEAQIESLIIQIGEDDPTDEKTNSSS